MLRDLWRRKAAEAELDEELAYHLERETGKLMRTGLPPEEARRRARLAMGGPAQIKEEVRHEWGWHWLEGLLQDGRYAFRALRQSPLFAAAAVLSLALGIGANTAIFSIVNAVLMKSLPVKQPERLGHLFRHGRFDDFTYALWTEIRGRQDVFSSVLACSPVHFDLATGGEKRLARGLYVSGDYFRTLGVAPLIGRALTVDDDQPGGGSAGPVAVISYGFWQRELGGDPHIAGRTIRLDGHPFQVVGVTPRGFFGVEVGETFDVAVPLTSEAVFDAGHPMMNGGATWWLAILGRLKPGVSQQQATARMKVLAPAVFRGALATDLPKEFQEGFLKDTLDVGRPRTGSPVCVTSTVHRSWCSWESLDWCS